MTATSFGKALLLATFIWTGAVHADATADPLSPLAVPLVKESLDNGSFVIDGQFALDPSITRAQVWSVISDYGHLKDFVSSIRKSEVRGRGTDTAVVEQEAVGKWFLFSRSVSVLLAIHETPQRSIEFHDVSRKDFGHYAGSWTISQVGDRLEVEYHLQANPSAALPVFVVEKVIRDDATGLLQQVRAEIVRRAGARPSSANP